MKEVVEVLVSALVDDPDSIEVEEESKRGDTIYLTVRVAQSDIGKVIGRGGRIANAIRTVANAAASKENRRAVVDITT